MCLYIYNEKAFIKRLTKAGKRGLLVSKEYIIRDGNLFPIFYNDYIPIRPGWIISDRRSQVLTRNEISYNVVNHGIHVYTHKKTLLRHRGITAVRVFKKDLVAVGHGDAVFMKVFLTKKEYNLVILA